MASKRPPTKKKSPPPKDIKVNIDLGRRKPTKDQLNRLKAYLDCQILTWIKVDLKESDPAPTVTCYEGGNGGGGDDEGGKGGNG